MTDAQDIDLYKDFITMSIEKALTQIGSPIADEVSIRLNESFNSDFSDCLDHPEYLNQVLKDIFGNSYLKIVKLINDQLYQLKFDEPIENFLKLISK